MVQHHPADLDASFAALADMTRRGMLDRLARGHASITELAGQFGMTLTGTKKHVAVLERVGLVTTAKHGRVRTCRLGPGALEAELAWIESHRALWAARVAVLEDLVEQLDKETGR